MWLFGDSKKKKEKIEKELELQEKIRFSQERLLEAATNTANAAQVVTTMLKHRLEDSINQFENTARMMKDAFIICDIDGTIQSFNPAAEYMFGINAIDIVNKSILDIFISDAEDDLEIDEFLSELNNKELIENEFMFVKDIRGVNQKTKTDFYIDSSVCVLERYDRANIMLIIIRDISMELNLVNENTDITKKYNAMFDSSMDGILIVQNMKIVAANIVSANLFGYEKNELLTKSIDNLISENDKTIIKSSNINNSVPSKINGITEDGNHLQLLYTTAMVDWNNEPACLITIKDITDKRKLEHIIENSSEYGIDLYCSFDNNFLITFVNEKFSKYVGFPKNKLIGINILELMDVAEKDAFLLHINSLTEETPTRRMQYQCSCEKGKIQVYDWIDHATFNDSGEIIEYQRTGRNISKVLENAKL